MFKKELCDLCGDCLVECRWIDVDRHQAIEWMREMINGEATPALHKCITCYACNEMCPAQANPFDLMATLQKKYRIFITEEDAVKTEKKPCAARPSN